MQTSAGVLHEVDWDFPKSHKADTIHTIHPYPAKFIPEIPRTLIERLGVPGGTWVLDPFCGSGATLVEANVAGYSAMGIDLNPIACLITRVKTQPLTENILSKASDLVLQIQMHPAEVEIPDIPNLNHWFKVEIQEAVARLLVHIEKVEPETTKDALRLALSSILVQVSNQDSDTRYAAVEKNVTREDVYTRFLSACERIWKARLTHKPPTTDAHILRNDIMKVQPSDIPYPVGLVITSPPYPNAYEYWLYHKYRMFWLGYDPIEVKTNEIGARAHYFKKNHPTIADFERQMRHLLSLFQASVVDGGHVCIIIGRSKIHGEIVDNAELIARLGIETGFDLLAKIPRRIASNRKSFNLSHAKIKQEHLLVFRK